MDLNSYILFWVCVIGLCLGSFYNVVILRSLSNESIVFPPSKCPKCNHKLYFWHNIPVLSYVLLGGKCYFCKDKISIQYPIVEILTMILFGLTFYNYGISYVTLFVLCWVSGMIIMTVTDLKAQVVECNIAIGMGLLGFVYNSVSGGWQGLFYSFLGALICVILFEGIARLGYLVAKTRAMGEADTYVAGALGAIFTLTKIFPILLYCFAAAMLFIVPMFLYKKYKNGDKVTIIFSILFALSIGLYFYSLNVCTLGLLVVFGGLLAYRIIKTMSDADNLNYLPFVPALAAGALAGFFIF
ncbi:prepilin peptidase [bacterium]|nr:prepilin peptidase [bacterium]